MPRDQVEGKRERAPVVEMQKKAVDLAAIFNAKSSHDTKEMLEVQK